MKIHAKIHISYRKSDLKIRLFQENFGFSEGSTSFKSALGAANNHARLLQTSTLMTTGGLLRAAFDAASSSTGAGLATPENVSPPTHSVVTVSALLQCIYEARI